VESRGSAARRAALPPCSATGTGRSRTARRRRRASRRAPLRSSAHRRRPARLRPIVIRSLRGADTSRSVGRTSPFARTERFACARRPRAEPLAGGSKSGPLRTTEHAHRLAWDPQPRRSTDWQGDRHRHAHCRRPCPRPPGAWADRRAPGAPACTPTRRSRSTRPPTSRVAGCHCSHKRTPWIERLNAPLCATSSKRIMAPRGRPRDRPRWRPHGRPRGPCARRRPAG